MSAETIVATLCFNRPLIASGGSFIVPDAEDKAAGGSAASDAAVIGVKEIHLHEGRTIRVGRAKFNDLVVQNRNVSRFHAVFSASSSGVVLSDLSSLNGTMVNGQRISTPVDISSGDVVTIGDAEISVRLALGESESGESTHGRTQTAQLAAVVVTVLVVDVCGYTKLSEALPPRDVVQMMHLWFQSIADIVAKHGGEVDKYIGDCVMALWRSKDADAVAEVKAAAQAAKEMLSETKRLATSGQWPHQAMFPWSCRVALNTGEALMGSVGGGGKRDFTVLGDTVNVAFRLEGLASELKTDLVLSAKTAQFLGADQELKSLGKVQVEGRSGDVEIFSLDWSVAR